MTKHSLKEDVQTIKERLTGDARKDIRILFDASTEFANRSYSNQLNKAISDIMDDIMAKADPKVLTELSGVIQKKTASQFEESLLVIRNHLLRHHPAKAYAIADSVQKQVEETLTQAISTAEVPKPTFLYFYTLSEKALLERYFPSQNSILMPVDVISLLSLKANAAYVLKKEQEAISLLRKALEFNPVYVPVMFLLADIDANNQNWISFSMDLEKIHRYLFQPDDFFRYYDYVALSFQESDPAFSKKIHSAFKSKGKPYEVIERLDPKFRDSLLEKEIPLTLSEEVNSTLKQELQVAETQKNAESTQYFQQLLGNYEPNLTIAK